MTENSKKNRYRLAVLGLLLATVAWGASFFLVKKATAMIGIWPFLTARFLIATIVFAVLFHRKLFTCASSTIFRGAVLGILLFLGLGTQTIGLQLTSASRAGFLTSLYLPLTPLFAYLLIGSKITWLQTASVIIALAGSTLMTLGNSTQPANWGDLLIVCTAFIFAGQIVFTEIYARRDSNTLGLGLWQFIGCAACLCFAVVLGADRLGGTPEIWDPSRWPSFAWGSVLFNALVSTCLCFTLQIYSQKAVDSLKAALIYALEGPFAALFAHQFVGEMMTPKEGFGAVLIFLASIIPDKWIRKAKEKTHGAL